MSNHQNTPPAVCWGMTQIAQVFGVTPQTIRNWAAKDDHPINEAIYWDERTSRWWAYRDDLLAVMSTAKNQQTPKTKPKSHLPKRERT